ncbi:MAG: STAS/SEC14 domain-containing protein [Erythrobacter sp.]|nr:STAS/SEC14 domain-containing protein [Erythrobacter sp.]
MFTKLETPPHVFAYQFSGTITVEDVDAIYDEMVEALKKYDKVSCYAELLDEFDMEAKAAWRDLKRSPEMLGHFRKFDRIAFVAKPSWITAIAKFEDAVLSMFDFNMEVFDPEERERALAWAKGEVDETEGPSVRMLQSEDPGIAIYEIDGKIRKRDMAVGKEILQKFLDDREPRKLMAVIKDFAGFELALLADRELFRMKLEAAKHLDRYAFVGAPKWLEGYISTMDTLTKPEMRTFDADERDEALAWLREDELVA